MKRIMLICSAGMSTSLLVQKMEAAAKETGVECKIWACGEAEGKKQLDNVDVILLGPQVRFIKDQMVKAIGDRPVKLEVIDTMSYGRMDGKAVLKQGLALCE